MYKKQLKTIERLDNVFDALYLNDMEAIDAYLVSEGYDPEQEYAKGTQMGKKTVAKSRIEEGRKNANLVQRAKSVIEQKKTSINPQDSSQLTRQVNFRNLNSELTDDDLKEILSEEALLENINILKDNDKK
jgi:hypothetical protein